MTIQEKIEKNPKSSFLCMMGKDRQFVVGDWAWQVCPTKIMGRLVKAWKIVWIDGKWRSANENPAYFDLDREITAIS